MQLTPDTPIQFLKGVGPHLAQLFEKRSVTTAWDLLYYLPVKYVDRRQIHSIQDLPEAKKMTFLAAVKGIGIKTLGRRRRILEMLVADSTGHAKIVFFQFNEAWLKKKFPEGSRVIFFGDVKRYGAFKQMVHPEMELWEEDIDPSPRIYPFYPLTEGLHQKTVRRIMAGNLAALLTLVADDPRSVRETGAVQIPLADAFCHVHMPPPDADIALLNSRATREHQRIIYDEFFYLELGLVSKRYKSVKQAGYSVGGEKKLFATGVSALPFELTAGQRQALDDIAADFTAGKPMNRLLQGDVGSGKTLVAFLSSLLVIESRLQTALMVPTEILAEQHFKTLLKFEDKLGIHIELLTSSTPDQKRADILGHLKAGRVELLIGTHALITPDVEFHRLGYVIIDEQHRFGVLQRAQLKNKAKREGEGRVPHILFMTATPIPRTLSMCVYGDLDVSIIRELPRGRKPVVTKVFHEKQRTKAYALIRKELQQGRQTYFVYPLVEESEKLEHLKDATLMHQELTRVFEGFAVGLLHGKMKSAEKEVVMAGFKAGRTSVLVSTTVIEVGVDVPNATVMVVEHAERFGLSQLHQLRGRVGRGAAQSYCILLAGYAQSEEGRFRLRVMEDTHDGFVIAEEDLKLRGPGEFLGTKQAGLPDFRLAEIVRDGHLLSAAKKRAEEILAADPDLVLPQNVCLRDIMLARWGKRLDLTLV